MFRDPEGKKVFEKDCVVDFPTDADGVNMDIQKVYGTKDSSGGVYRANPPISVSAPKPLLYKVDLRSVLPTKTPSFESSNF